LVPSWFNAEYLINWFGSWALWGIAGVILIETGLMFPFLPGDSLLFTAGVFTANGTFTYPIALVVLITGGAALLGPQIGYWLGRLIGPRLFDRPDSRFFKRAYIDKTHAFFDKYGGRAIVLGQFVPFVRTYLPVAAGIGKMPYSHFAGFNVIGAAAWGVGVTMLGYSLGNVAVVKDHYTLALALIVLVSVTPMIVEFLRHRAARRRENATAA
jgi:membrane-associated protein